MTKYELIMFVLLLPYNYVIYPIAYFDYLVIFHMVYMPVYYVYKTLLYVFVVIPTKPVNYVLLIGEEDYSVLEMGIFLVNVMHYVIVGMISGLFFGYILGKQLIMLKSMNIADKPERSKLIQHLPETIKSLPQGEVMYSNYYEDDDGYDFARRFEKEGGSRERGDEENVNNVSSSEGGEGDINVTEETKNTLFDEYLNSTRMTTLGTIDEKEDN